MQYCIEAALLLSRHPWEVVGTAVTGFITVRLLNEEELPEGYDTYVGERGVRLSGGQRQRIGIARALYRQAEVIVLDEATSALDNETETSVMEAINALPQNITVLIIAHRLTTLRDCARIAVFDRGRIVGLGPWANLMTENDVFQRIAATTNVD